MVKSGPDWRREPRRIDGKDGVAGSIPAGGSTTTSSSGWSCTRPVPYPQSPDRGRAAWQQAQQPTLYLHGSADGCTGVELVRGAERHLGQGSRMAVAEGAGHLLHLERPEEASEHVLAWVTG